MPEAKNTDDLFRKIENDIEELEKNLDKSTPPRDISSIVSETEDILSRVSEPMELVELIIDLVVEFTNAERGFLMLFDAQNKLQFKIGRDNKGKNLEESAFRISQTIAKKTLEKEGTIYVNNAQANDQYKDRKSIQELDIQTVMCTPLLKGERTLGIIYVDSRLTTREFTEEDLEVFEAFANHVVKYL